MIIYKDRTSSSQDEVLTDIYPMKMEYGNQVMVVTGKLTTETTDIDESAIGGNASAEGGGDEGGEASSVSGINVVIANRLFEMQFSKKTYTQYMKTYLKTIVGELKDDQKDDFKNNIQSFVKDVRDNFDDYQFYVGESMDAEGLVILCKWDGETPYLYYIKQGLIEEKV